MPSCFLKNPLPLMMYVLGLLLVSNFVGYGLISSSIIILILLSNLIFTFSKQTPVPEKSVLQSTKLALVLAEPETEHIDQTKEKEEEFEDGQALTTQMRESWDDIREMPLRQNSDPVTKIIDDEESFPSLIMVSESGRSSTSTEDSDEAEYWPYSDQGNIFRSRENSDGSISDEDSLIEISLPSGVYIDHYKEEEEKKMGFYKQRMCLAELLSEVNYENEEDNLFEIDLSIGSIMSPRFEIHA